LRNRGGQHRQQNQRCRASHQLQADGTAYVLLLEAIPLAWTITL
jgi:hypothetical protein